MTSFLMNKNQNKHKLILKGKSQGQGHRASFIQVISKETIQ